VYEVGESFMLQNGYVRAEFDKNGILQTITTIDDRKKEKVALVSLRDFLRHGFRGRIRTSDRVTRLGNFSPIDFWRLILMK
jgi:hypothetical protein